MRTSDCGIYPDAHLERAGYNHGGVKAYLTWTLLEIEILIGSLRYSAVAPSITERDVTSALF